MKDTEKAEKKDPYAEVTVEDEQYLAARRVRSQHNWFMREFVEPARRGKL